MRSLVSFSARLEYTSKPNVTATTPTTNIFFIFLPLKQAFHFHGAPCRAIPTCFRNNSVEWAPPDRFWPMTDTFCPVQFQEYSKTGAIEQPSKRITWHGKMF